MMTRIVVGSIALLSLLACVSSKSADTNVSSAASPEVSVFVGTSPCAGFAKPFLAIPAAEPCDRIKWQLSLDDSGKYVLRREWGYHVDNRTYLPKGQTNIEGTWKTAKGGTSTPVVVQLAANGRHSITFALVDQNVLHLRDANQNLAIGDSGASYTLSRNRQSSVLTDGNHGLADEKDLKAETIFSGRSPCREMAQALNRAVEPDCFKLKWLLTLHRDPKNARANHLPAQRKPLPDRKPRHGKPARRKMESDQRDKDKPERSGLSARRLWRGWSNLSIESGSQHSLLPG